MFVKPANLGSSVGISKVHDPSELGPAIEDAARYDSKIVVEKGISARELECSVLGNEEAKSSLPGELIPKREFYDYTAKYIEDTTELHIPAKLEDEKIQEIQRIAVRAFQSIGCSGMARVDLFLERESEIIYLNEINTIPGFTNISMYPKLWEISGLPFQNCWIACSNWDWNVSAINPKTSHLSTPSPILSSLTQRHKGTKRIHFCSLCLCAFVLWF